MVTLDELEVFVAVAEELHLGRAAARCRMTTSAASKRLRKLERTVGVRLFDRTSRRVVLTPAAELLLEQARRALAEAEAFGALAAAAAAGKAGRVRLLYGVNHARFLTELLRALAVRSPRIEVDFRERSSGPIADAVLSGDASIGLCVGSVPPGLASFCFEVTCYDTLFVARGHRLASADAVTPEDCAGESFIFTGHDPNELWRGRDLSFTLRPLLGGGREEVATRIETGEGIALTTSAVVDAFRHRAVVAVPLRDASTWGYLEQLMVWRADDDSPLVHEIVAVGRDLRNEVSTRRASRHAATRPPPRTPSAAADS